MEEERLADLERLRQFSTSPYEPEAPRKKLPVNLMVHLARRLGRPSVPTPHLSGSSHEAKIEWESRAAPEFWSSLQGFATMDLLDHKRVLDVGCGWGGKMIYLATHTKLESISGFDLPGLYLPEVSARYAAARNVHRCEFTTGFAEAIPFEDQVFEVVLMEDVLEHVEDPEQVIQECYRVMKPGGTLILKFPSFRSMFSHHLDRVLSWPALHYLLPMKTWAGGLNYLLLRAENKFKFEPFDQVVATKYHAAVTRNLNGLDFANFSQIVGNSPFQVRVLQLVPFPARGEKNKALKNCYRLLSRFKGLKEFLASFVLFIGQRGPD